MAKDPYRYFRVEAREILEGLTRDVLELEKGSGGKDAVARLLRLAHTLKGAARVVKLARTAELAHGLEDALAPYRETGGPVRPELPNELLRAIDAIGAELARLAAPEPAASGAELARPEPVDPGGRSPPATGPESPRRETVRLDVVETDALLEGIAEAAIKASGLGRHVEAAEHAARACAVLSKEDGTRRAGELGAALDRLSHDLRASVEATERELAQVRERAERLRLVPASEAFSVLERAVRDAAQSLGKRVGFETQGEDVRVDAHVLSGITEALLHIVRNAVAHGIETEADRVARGKPPAGKVSLSVERRAGKVAFACRDDGRGIDVDAVRKAAVARGVISRGEAEALTREEAVSLLMRGGVSTARGLSQVAGRGVGLDVVREVVARLRGDVAILSGAEGTTVELRVPVSLASVPALLVEAEGWTVALPLDAVARTLRVAESDVVRSGGATIRHDGAWVPFAPLGAVLGARTKTPPRVWSAVVLGSGGRLVAIGVERVLGTGAEVVRPLPEAAGRVAIVAGAALDPEGNPRLMLDAARLVERVAAGVAVESAAPPSRPPVLVIDDSLTTRMLEQSILESAGWEVEVATSAEEGLAKARTRTFGVFVVDVEMPGMDGYEFVAATRKDPVLGRTPAILVTSRGSPEDRRRGADAGAKAYIVKGEFDQGRLLSAIAELVR